MPTYDYRCQACDHEFEEFQSFSDKPLKKCPRCRKSKLQRLLGTGAAIIFKGSGFYQTDYRSESYKTAAKADTEKSASADKSKTAETSPASPPPASKEGTSSGKKGKSAS